MKTNQDASRHLEIHNHLLYVSTFTGALLEEDLAERAHLVALARSTGSQPATSRTGDGYIKRCLVIEMGKAATAAFTAALPEGWNFEQVIAVNSQPKRQIADADLLAEFEERPNRLLVSRENRCPFRAAMAYLEKFENSTRAERAVIASCHELAGQLNQHAQLAPWKTQKIDVNQEREARKALQAFDLAIENWEKLTLFDPEQKAQIGEPLIGLPPPIPDDLVRAILAPSAPPRNRQPLGLKQSTRHPKSKTDRRVLQFPSDRLIDKD